MIKIGAYIGAEIEKTLHKYDIRRPLQEDEDNHSSLFEILSKIFIIVV